MNHSTLRWSSHSFRVLASECRTWCQKRDVCSSFRGGTNVQAGHSALIGQVQAIRGADYPPGSVFDAVLNSETSFHTISGKAIEYLATLVVYTGPGSYHRGGAKKKAHVEPKPKSECWVRSDYNVYATRTPIHTDHAHR
jgi:hypothetical protein